MLPNLIVIGAMKCGTTAVHRYLGDHPDVAMSRPKELNFFFGPTGCEAGNPGACRVAAPDDQEWSSGTWNRGVDWYADQFPDDARVRGESSPGYTSPSHAAVAARMAQVLPDARLVYLVRDPIARAISQYRHHRADATELRPLSEALLDPDSQYIARGRYLERLEPFLIHYPPDQILVVAQEQLESDCPGTMAALYRFVGVRDTWVPERAPSDPSRPRGAFSGEHPPPVQRSSDTLTGLDPWLRDQLVAALSDDAARFRSWCGKDFPDWSL